MKKRIIYDKYGDMKYISHLDNIRFLERLFKKSNIDIKYSEGFHPRAKISFGNPVSLGQEMYNEIMDAEITSDKSDKKILALLNANSPTEYNFHSISDVPKKSCISKDFDILIYEIESNKENIDILEDVLNSNEIIEIKEKRGKKITRDLKNKIGKIERIKNKICVELYNISPKALFLISKIDVNQLVIKRMGYKKYKIETEPETILNISN